MNIRIYNQEKDVDYVETIFNSEEYKSKINYDDGFSETSNLYVLYCKDEKIGFFQMTDIDRTNKTVNLNIFYSTKNYYINGKFFFEIVRMLFREKDFNKIIFKVKKENIRMIKILNRFGIYCEGEIPQFLQNRINTVLFYSLLRSEYIFYHNTYNG